MTARLKASFGHAPDDLLAYFSELASEAFVASNADARGELLSIDAAIAETRMLDGLHPLMSMLGALVLDETNTSDYHVYLAKPPLQGCIMFLSHDGESRIVYDSPQRFLDAVKAGTNYSSLEDLHPLHSPIVADQSGLARFIEANLDHDDVDMIMSVAIGCLEVEDTALTRQLATHDDFYVVEALGEAITLRPAPELLGLADLCAAHPHPQAAQAGRRAQRAIEARPA